MLGEFIRALPEPTWHDCSRCGAKHTRVGVCFDCDMALERDAEDAKRAAKLQRRLEASILPDFAWTNFDAPELAARVRSKTAIEAARRATHARRVVLMGPGGSGKTSLAVAMLRAWAARHPGEPALFVPAYRLSGAGWTVDDDHFEARVLVLDDLGSERKLASTVVPELVYERHGRGRATWVTTGFDEEMIAERYGDGVMRRLFEEAVVVYPGGAPQSRAP